MFRHTLLTLLTVASVGCGLNAPYPQDIGPQRPRPTVRAIYPGFELASRNDGKLFTELVVFRNGSESGGFSVDIPEIGRINFSDFDSRIHEWAKACDCDEQDEDRYCKYGNLSMLYSENRFQDVFVTEESRGSIKPAVPVFYRDQPISFPLTEKSLRSLFGKPQEIKRE